MLKKLAPSLALFVLSCTPDPADPPPPEAPKTIAIEATEQRAGDPQAGYTRLVNDGYVGCGIPMSAYSVAFGPAPERDRLPGRNANNESLRYDLNAFTTSSGVEVVSATCLTCHAARLRGELVIGLGAHSADFTVDPSAGAGLARALLSDEDEIAEFDKWLERTQTVAPFLRTKTIGVNPADNLAAALFAHRDRETLAWSTEPLMEPPTLEPLPVDVPPWWRMSKKNALYYPASGKGDHGRLMMTASTLCVDEVAEAVSIDSYFNDVSAYIKSIEAPAYPFAIDDTLAATGEALFEQTCAQCHGTYGVDERYPNLVVPLDEIGTDPLLAQGAQYEGRFTDWFNGSFYGETASIDPEEGYIAPPLDGIWATAPFFHNGSVPTLLTVLDSTRRPEVWTRDFSDADLDDDDFDVAEIGWRYEVREQGQVFENDPNVKKTLYDTSLTGYGNGGHTYGDAFTDEERDAVLEYLKTL